GWGARGEGSWPQLAVPARSGGYWSLSIEPRDGCTFWYTNEYYRATGGDWATRIGAFRFPSCDDGPSLSIGDVSVHEGETADLTVTLSQASSQDVSVQYQTVTDTATSSDFADTSGTLTFAPGQTQATISVPVNTDDVTEPNEDFAVLLSNPSGAG